ncbi:hypothetical protein NP233_g8046 [Leucocoprinus birnbaumii]|uniref:Cupredoxin n=1 Tax=Leucocoprinus birnbaumii TaxID=56174 RepID=A0AAD5YPE7_9AGAR|nr:hypothetical protein NP233_g8046 [Leucocoprinus birnbaumii]
MFSVVAFTLASALAASAADITVNVGANNGLVFDPPQVTAQPGDQIHFEFQSKNHSVTQSTFAAPCVKSPTGIDSGFMFVDPNAADHPVWTMQVADTTPLWFFCAQTNPAVHCTAGMVFAVNPTADKSFDQFLATAKSGGSASNSTASPSGSVIPAPSSLPTGGAGTGASGAPAGASGASPSGFATSISGSPSATGSAAGAASSTAAPNGAVGLNSAGAVGLVSMFAALAGFML